MTDTQKSNDLLKAQFISDAADALANLFHAGKASGRANLAHEAERLYARVLALRHHTVIYTRHDLEGMNPDAVAEIAFELGLGVPYAKADHIRHILADQEGRE